ncbi:MAG TPA: glycosyltransferase family 39 protein [Steroidobacteraceae bacterium]|nr:glycosyltransferase family 39 protein [Steroidobacteraceae bacterium]
MSAPSLATATRALPESRARLLVIACWFLLILASMFAWLGSYPLFEPDEGRNAEVAREMVATGDFTVPHLNGLPYVDKPALYFSVVATSLRAFGLDEFAARLPSLIFTIITALMIGWFGRRLWNSRVGAAAAAMTLSAPLAFGMSRVVILDSLFSMLVVGSLVGLYLAIEARAAASAAQHASGGSRRWSSFAWACIGLGILTKGPVALMIPLAAGIPYAVRRRALPAVLFGPGVILASIVVAPWVVQMSQALPGYLHYVLVTETWARVSSDQLHRSEPFWFFVPVLVVGTMPWIGAAVAGVWSAIRGRSRTRLDHRLVFLALWVVVPFVLFSLSRSKLPHYMLPLVPAVALLAAAFMFDDTKPVPTGRPSGSVMLVTFGLAAIGAALFLRAGVRLDATALAAARTFFSIYGAAALAAGVAGLVAKPRGAALVAVFSLPMIVAGFASGPLLKEAADDDSAREFARIITQRVPDHPIVIGVRAFPTSLPFYLRGPVQLSSTSGIESTSNYVHAKFDELLAAPGSTLHDADWWRHELEDCRQQTFFVVQLINSTAADRLTKAGLPLAATSRRYALYGPCQPVARTAE